jgi:hypothetical protein
MFPPTDQWGIEYIGVPHAGRKASGNYYRIISAENENTIVTTRGEFSLNAGEWKALSHVDSAIHFLSSSGKRFLVIEYAYPPQPSGDNGLGDPTMIALTPVSHFVKTAQFRTPVNIGTSFKHYASIIFPESAMGKVTLKKGSNMPTSLSAFGAQYWAVSGTSFIGATVLLSGEELAWSIASPDPIGFVLYGQANAEAYGIPGNRSFTVSGDSSAPQLVISAADACGNYSINASDPDGIADVYLIPSLGASRFGVTTGTENYTIAYVKPFQNGDTAAKFYALVTDASKPATLALYIVDKSGNDTVITTTYSVRQVEWKLDEPFPAVTRVGDTVCRTVTLRNLHSDSAYFFPRPPHPESAFHLSPTGDFRLAGNESMKFELCFIPKDSLTYSDSISIATECYDTGFVATAHAAQSIITATDEYFGLVPRGEKKCRTVRIANLSELPFTVLGYTHSGDAAFSIGSTTFPITLAAGARENVEVCFTPDKDSGDFSARFDWILDYPTTTFKTYSRLTGIARPSSSVAFISDQVNVWPNPAMNEVRISMPDDLNIMGLSAIDLLGRSYSLVSSADGRVIDVSMLPSGAYSLVLHTSRGEITKPLVIKR